MVADFVAIAGFLRSVDMSHVEIINDENSPPSCLELFFFYSLFHSLAL